MTDAERARGAAEGPVDDQHEQEQEQGRPVIRDRRRIDPDTGEARPSSSPATPGAAGAETAADPAAGSAGTAGGPAAEGAAAGGQAAGGDALAQAQAEAAERLDDLRRLQAEYVNYRRRVERDRELVREQAKAEVLSELLPVLDDIGRAREHGDLTGAFRSVGEALEAVTTKAGLVRFGEPGDEFDPKIHEALMHGYADDVQVPTCTQILQPGYRVGERVVRPARVAVAEPTEALPNSPDEASTADKSDKTGEPGESAENGD